jgi:hypothetical protein
MVWSWQVYDRIYALTHVNIASTTLKELLASSPTVLRAMVDEVRASKVPPIPPVDVTQSMDAKEVDEVVCNFFGLAIPKGGIPEIPSTGVDAPIST